MAELVAPARCATSACREASRGRRSAARTRSIRSPRCRPSTRCGRAIPRTTACWRPVASSASASSRTARSAAASSPGASSKLRRSAGRRLPPPLAALPGRELRARTCELVREIERLAREKKVHGIAARAGVGAGARRRHRADPGHERAHVSRGEHRRGRNHASVAEDLARIDAIAPKGVAAGGRYPASVQFAR